MYSIIQILYNYNSMCIIIIMCNYQIKMTLISETHINVTLPDAVSFHGKNKMYLNHFKITFYALYFFS